MPRLVGVCSHHTLNIWAIFLIQMDEIWKPVLGYEGLYEVSSLGRVRSLDRAVYRKNGGAWRLSGRILSQAYCKDGRCPTYITPTVILTKDGVGKTYKVAPLVCVAFHGPRPNGYQCMHLDGDSKNNKSDNLCWGTIHENSNEPIRRRRLSEAAKTIVPLIWKSGAMDGHLRACVQYSISGDFIAEYKSIKLAAKATGGNERAICDACRGRYKTSGGYIWKYK